MLGLGLVLGVALGLWPPVLKKPGIELSLNVLMFIATPKRGLQVE